jgi:3',5'-cyclic AMP phosphodiesterase CpdA
MPGIHYQPVDRRSFLKWSAAGAAMLVAGCQSASRRSASDPSLHLALLSDTHVPADRVNGHRGFNPWENLRRIIPEVAASAPEGAIVCGDGARLEGKVGDYEELRALLQPVAATCPVTIALGNHDDRENFTRVFGSLPGPSSAAGGRHVLVMEHPAVRIVVLDSLLYVNRVAGLLGKAQREWLAGFLSQHRDRPVALFVHHTLEDRDGDLLDADRLFGLLESHRHVKAIFYGHSHVWEQRERHGIHLINLPAVGYNFRDQDPLGWVDARFHRRGVDLTLHAFAGNRTVDGQRLDVQWS